MESRSPVAWAIRPFQKYATFSGRAPRAEFWWFTLLMMIFYLVVFFLMTMLLGNPAAMNPASAIASGSLGVGAILMIIFWLAVLIPSIAVQVRRLHDINRSGWWLGAFWVLYIVYMGLAFSTVGVAGTAPGNPPSMGGLAAVGIVAIVMLVYSIALIVFWCKRGTPGPNGFGEDPYGANVEEVFR